MRFLGLARFGRLFPRSNTLESVQTLVHFDASPERVWRGMLFYEEVPGQPTALLRMFLPAPVRTQGEKTRVGASIQCTYEAGYLEKKITESQPPSFVRFDVSAQELGIEDCISMAGGSYEIRADARGSEVVLTTRYRGHLRPRWLWRPFEHYLAHRLHRHILEGMRAALAVADRSLPAAEEASVRA